MSGGATGGQMWMTGTYDPELNLVFVGTGNPTPVLNGAGAARRQPWTCSIVALNPDTGKLAWGFQASPHDTHDWDAAEVPVLVDAPIRRRAAQAAAAGVAQRLLLRARSHDGQEPADDAVCGRRTGRRAWTRTVGRCPTRRRSRRAMAGLWRRTKPAAPTIDRQASIPPPACSSSARTTPTASISSSRSTARMGGRARTTACTGKGVLRAIDYQTGKMRWSHDLQRRRGRRRCADDGNRR